MKLLKGRYALFLLIILIGISCSTDEADATLVGKWLLIERLVDPGDGSGTFQPVTSSKTIEFFSDNTFKSNGDMCFMYTDAGTSTSGTFSLDTNVLTPQNCSPSSFEIHFSLENNYLIISYTCIEPCRQKFAKISNG